MSQRSALWPARLHHLRYDSQQPEAMARFYRDGLGMEPRELGESLWLMAGGERRVLIGGGETELAFSAFALENSGRLDDFRAHVLARGLNPAPAPTPLFAEGAFMVHDPDGRGVVFGVPAGPADAPDGGRDRLAGRLQHVVVASTRVGPMTAFYEDVLGFVVSDRVLDEGGEVSACFLRSDPEHHSFAVFRAPEARPDHHAYEARDWNDIRDWADHFATLEVPIFWGPGRHGPGNNLFIMVEDPDGNKVEVSAEIELMHRHMPPRQWAHEERTLNLWGGAWMRS